MGLIERNYMLQFPLHDAEQHFLDWYFKFTRRVCITYFGPNNYFHIALILVHAPWFCTCFAMRE